MIGKCCSCDRRLTPKECETDAEMCPQCRAELKTKTVWVTYYNDFGPHVNGVYQTEIDALRDAQRSGGFFNAIEVPLPCADIPALIREKP